MLYFTQDKQRSAIQLSDLIDDPAAVDINQFQRPPFPSCAAFDSSIFKHPPGRQSKLMTIKNGVLIKHHICPSMEIHVIYMCSVLSPYNIPRQNSFDILCWTLVVQMCLIFFFYRSLLALAHHTQVHGALIAIGVFHQLGSRLTIAVATLKWHLTLWTEINHFGLNQPTYSCCILFLSRDSDDQSTMESELDLVSMTISECSSSSIKNSSRWAQTGAYWPFHRLVASFGWVNAGWKVCICLD